MAATSLWDARYVVVDVETTGSDPSHHRIMEIACLVVEEGTITERFVSLVNPHQPVPPSISALTGITNGMLANAPEEADVFRHVLCILAAPDTILVAHNAAFDWKFLQSTFQRLGYGSPEIARLCTYRLARRLLSPAIRRLGLDGLIAHFNLRISRRHRAEPDAEATAQILLHLLRLAASQGYNSPAELLRLQHAPHHHLYIPQHLRRQLNELPEASGVYSFYDRSGELLYIGKARNLSRRIRSHFCSDDGLWNRLSGRRIWSIRWEETPTELSALLREVERIWREQPPANSVGKELETYAFVRLTLSDRFPRLLVEMETATTDDPLIGPLPSRLLAAHLLQFLQRQYRLRPCTDLLQNAPNEPACFYAELGSCSAPCNGTTSELAYRQQVQHLLKGALYGIPSWAQAVFSGMQRYADQWAFEQAAVLRPLWRFLHRWGRSSLPLWLQACSFLLFVPATGKGWELTCFVRGSFRGHRVIQSLSDKAAIQDFLSECLQRPSQPTWLDIARLDALSRWLAQQSPEGCRLTLLSDGLPVPGIVGQPAGLPLDSADCNQQK